MAELSDDEELAGLLSEEEIARIKNYARSMVPLMGKIIVPSRLARRIRVAGAWDDESMVEQLPIPLTMEKGDGRT